MKWLEHRFKMIPFLKFEIQRKSLFLLPLSLILRSLNHFLTHKKHRESQTMPFLFLKRGKFMIHSPRIIKTTLLDGKWKCDESLGLSRFLLFQWAATTLIPPKTYFAALTLDFRNCSIWKWKSVLTARGNKRNGAHSFHIVNGKSFVLIWKILKFKWLIDNSGKSFSPRSRRSGRGKANTSCFNCLNGGLTELERMQSKQSL